MPRQKTTKTPPETLEKIKELSLSGMSGRAIGLHLGMNYRTVAILIKDILQLPQRPRGVRKGPSPNLARPVPTDRWAEMRDKERIVPDYIPHITATMGGRYVPKELDYRGRQ